MSFRKGLVLAMEDADAPLVNVEINAEQDVPAELEADMTETAEDGAAVDDMATSLESAIDDIDTLDRTADILEASEADGGADPVAAQIAEVAVESISVRLFGEKMPMVIPAMESFQDSRRRATSTSIAVENIREWSARAVEAIKKFFRAVVDKITEFVDKIITFAMRQKPVALGFQKSAAKLKADNKKPTQEVFEDESLAAGNPAQGKLTAQAATSVVMSGAALMYMSGAFGESFGKMLDELQSAGGDKDQLLTKMGNLVQQVSKSGTKNGSGIDEVLGGKKVEFTVEGADSGSPKFTIAIKDSPNKNTDKQCQTLTPDEIDDLAKEVVVLCDDLASAKKAVLAFRGADKRLEKLFDKAIGGEKTSEEAAKPLRDAVMSAGAAFKTMYKDFPQIAVKSNKFAIDYMSRSLKQYPGMTAKEAYDKASGAVTDGYNKAKDAATGGYNKAKDATTGGYNKAKDAATGAYNSAKNKFGSK